MCLTGCVPVIIQAMCLVGCVQVIIQALCLVGCVPMVIRDMCQDIWNRCFDWTDSEACTLSSTSR
ncbi:hypothetical protein ES319_D11G258500v1 [Gossypium barbadense]|nr:hypothetical protein ES319_D11G258500v1 [Gossypium barbadense]TYG46646.1 hypothetical protein ES288_D11G272300v1 [Gossypium darwinii]